MSIQEKLAHSLGRKDQEPNHELAQEIAANNDVEKLLELTALFQREVDKRLLMDAMLTIAYVAELNPKLVKPQFDFLLSKLTHPINRVNWGSMIALTHLAPLVTEGLFENLPTILDCMDSGGVVGRDYGFRVLVILYHQDKYSEDLFLIILEQLSKAPPNQIGQYTERLMAVLRNEHRKELIRVLEGIREDLTNEYHLKRLDKNLKRLYK